MTNIGPKDWTSSGIVPCDDVQWPAISLYLGGGSAMGLRYMRLIRKTEVNLSHWMSKDAAKKAVNPLYSFSVEEAWGSDPIAIFLSEKHFGLIRLVAPVEDFQVVAKSFHVKPLLSQELERPSFFLALWQEDRVSLYLYRGNQLQLRWRSEIKLTPMELVLELDKKIQEHPSNEYSTGRVLVVDSRVSFRAAHRSAIYSHWDTAVEMDQPSIEQLMTVCTEESRRLSIQRRQRLVEKFAEKRALGQTSDSLAEIFHLLKTNQVEHLLIARDRQVWGQLDLKQERLRLQATQAGSQADDLLDDISEYAINKGGRVSALPFVEMPTDGYAAAILRSK
jgi:hypothetical protein